MSVRTEPISQQLQNPLTITPEMAGAARGAMAPQQPTAVGADAAGPTESQLHEANTFNTTNEHHPLERTVCVNIRASLADLCLNAQVARAHKLRRE